MGEVEADVGVLIGQHLDLARLGHAILRLGLHRVLAAGQRDLVDAGPDQTLVEEHARVAGRDADLEMTFERPELLEQRVRLADLGVELGRERVIAGALDAKLVGAAADLELRCPRLAGRDDDVVLDDADARVGRDGLDADLRRQALEHVDAREHVLLVGLRIGRARVRLLRVFRYGEHVALEVRDRLRVLELALVGLADVFQDRVVRDLAVARDEPEHGAGVIALQVKHLATLVVLGTASTKLVGGRVLVGRARVDLEHGHVLVEKAALLRVRDPRDRDHGDEREPDPHLCGGSLGG